MEPVDDLEAAEEDAEPSGLMMPRRMLDSYRTGDIKPAAGERGQWGSYDPYS